MKSSYNYKTIATIIINLGQPYLVQLTANDFPEMRSKRWLVGRRGRQTVTAELFWVHLYCYHDLKMLASKKNRLEYIMPLVI